LFNATEEEFGERRLAEELLKRNGEGLQAMMDAIHAGAQAFAEDHQFTDDVCFVGLKLNRLAQPSEAVPTLPQPQFSTTPV